MNEFKCTNSQLTNILIYWQWVVQGAVSVDIGANPSAEGGEEGEGVDDQAVKVVDIVDTFRLQVVSSLSLNETFFFCNFYFGHVDVCHTVVCFLLYFLLILLDL